MPNQPQGTKARSTAGNIRTTHSKRGAYQHRDGDAVLCTSVGIEQHGDAHDQVTQQNGADGLAPTHAARDESGDQHVSENTNTHGPPKAIRNCRCPKVWIVLFYGMPLLLLLAGYTVVTKGEWHRLYLLDYAELDAALVCIWAGLAALAGGATGGSAA